MRIEIVNVKPECVQQVHRFLRKDLSKSLRIAKVRVRHRVQWVTTGTSPIQRRDGGWDTARHEELMVLPIVSFDLKPFPDDYAMRVLTTAFEGSGLAFNAANGFCWMVG